MPSFSQPIHIGSNKSLRGSAVHCFLLKTKPTHTSLYDGTFSQFSKHKYFSTLNML